MVSKDIAGKDYWDKCWETAELPMPIDPHLTSLDNYVNQRFHDYFREIFSGLEPSQMRLLEVGCGRSAWLPYFAKEFGFQVCGLDYSERGCQKAREILALAGVEGEVIETDFFTPPEAWLNRFNVVVTFGVVEHFQDTTDCLVALSRFLKSEGLLITSIPNLVGAIGLFQKVLNRSIFNVHVPLDLLAMLEAHQQAKLEAVKFDYFLSTNFGILNLEGLDSNQKVNCLKHRLRLYLTRISKLIWLAERKLVPLPVSQFFSPYIILVAKKP